MAYQHSSLEDRVESLTAQVRELQSCVDAMSRRVDGLASEIDIHSHVPMEGTADELPATLAAADKINFAEFLSELAIVCFVLVVALVLRTLVDNGIVQQRLGSLAGMAYGGSVMAFGYFRYATARRRAPVYVICGAMLLFSIVFETHTRFGLFSATFAYMTLDVILIAMTVLGLRYAAYVPVCVAVLGASATALVVKFPDAEFTQLATVLLLGILAANCVSFVRYCRWLPWCQFAIVLFFWLSWTFQLYYALHGGRRRPEEFEVEWFLPVVSLFAAIYVLTVLWSSLRRDWPVGWFETALPTLTVAWAYPFAYTIVVPWYGDSRQLGLCGVSGVIAFLLFAGVVTYRSHSAVRMATSFFAGALVLLASSLPARIGNFYVVMILWTATAAVVGVFSAYRNNYPGRILSYVFAVFVVAAAVTYGQMLAAPENRVGAILVAAILAGLSFVHLFVRPNGRLHLLSGRWQLVDPADRGGAVLLANATLYTFIALRLVLYATMVAHSEEAGGAFQCSQSVAINGFALILMTLGIACASADLVVLAVLFGLAGAAKVFGYDFWFMRGVPLVISVSFFAIAAALGSLLWTRWQHIHSKVGSDPAEPELHAS